MLSRQRVYELLVFSFFVALSTTIAIVALSHKREPPGGDNDTPVPPPPASCGTTCTFQVVESIPQQLELTPKNTARYTQDVFLEVIRGAKKTLHISAFYWNLWAGCNDLERKGGGGDGCNVFNAIIEAKVNRSVDIWIAQSAPSKNLPDKDSSYFVDHDIAHVTSLDFSKLYGDGVLHTKFIIADETDFYLGSANMDWCSLTQVKELGVHVSNCPCLANDLMRVWKSYWILGSNDMHISEWDVEDVGTQVNVDHPMSFSIGLPNLPQSKGDFFLSSSTEDICPASRTFDLDAFLFVINSAESYFEGSVMDFIPLKLYASDPMYWPPLFEALSSAVIDRGVHVRLLVSKWNHTNPVMFPLLQTLNDLNKTCDQSFKYPYCKGTVDVKIFVVPDLDNGLSFNYTRVNHAKYAITDQHAFITTSNWAWNYYHTTAGVSMIARHDALRDEVRWVFERDFNSKYAHPLSEFL